MSSYNFMFPIPMMNRCSKRSWTSIIYSTVLNILLHFTKTRNAGLKQGYGIRFDQRDLILVTKFIRKGVEGMKKRIVVLKKGVDKKAGPEVLCCAGAFLPAWG